MVPLNERRPATPSGMYAARVARRRGEPPIAGDAKGDPTFIGLLDVFGFEFFGTNNSFEQIMINREREAQQFFLKFVFKSEEIEYSEAIRWTPIEYQDSQLHRSD